jgi:proline iminopeptidase
VSATALFPDAAPRAAHALDVGDGHVLQVQEFGRADGIPALVLHGGPGSGCSPLLRRVFDPARWRVICPDLRRLREHLGVGRWVVVGGSWGATLALAHAADQPSAVAALLLRASFLARAEDIAGFFGALSLDELSTSLGSAEAAERERAALAWWRREQSLAGTLAAEPQGEALAAQIDRLRVQAHYLRHGCWLQSPGLLERCEAVPRVPVHLIHAGDDRVCPPDGALALQRRMPHATLQWIDGAGHDAGHPAMIAAVMAALASYADQGRFGAHA